MPRVLVRKSPAAFKTLPLYVEAGHDSLSYQSLGRPLNFAEVIKRRRPVEVADPGRFAIELANLGVSVRLTLCWQGREYWVLVRQQRLDRGDVVLKLISGYIPAHELNLPLLTAIQEIAEECLLETPEGWLAGRFGDTWLPTPYQASLHYREAVHFKLARAGTGRQHGANGTAPRLCAPADGIVAAGLRHAHGTAEGGSPAQPVPCRRAPGGGQAGGAPEP